MFKTTETVELLVVDHDANAAVILGNDDQGASRWKEVGCLMRVA